MSTIKEIKQKYYKPKTTTSWLRGKKIDLLDLELIISRVIKKPREFVLANLNYKLNKLKIENLKFKIARRAKGEPLAYIFGEKEFYGLNFKVNKNTLIPRPETELMVDEALRHVTRNPGRAPLVASHSRGQTHSPLRPQSEASGAGMRHTTFIDVGTGSGCIVITLAKQIPNSKFLATDISKPALRVAQRNAKFHKVDKKIKFLHGNLLEPILNKFKNKNSKIIITANLPYLTPIQIKNSPSIQHEPRLALDAGKDGLKYYRELFKQVKLLVANYQLPVTLLLEINPQQTIKIKKIIKNSFPKSKIHPVKSSRNSAGGISQNAKSFNGVEIKKDLNGLNRLVVIKLI